MNSLSDGSFRLFRVAGITVYLHWTWFLVAYFEIINPITEYRSQAWNVLEYLTLFGIVTLHEFGHALACRQVGGRAEQIVLWPLGGIAFVAPPPRPGALLWSIAAGPLVNVLLVPITIALEAMAANAGWKQLFPDAYVFIHTIAKINLVLLIFNILPIYPLDGGQILHALLWFIMGRASSLRVVCILGLFCGIVLIGVATIVFQSFWLTLIAAFMAYRSWIGFRQADLLSRPGMDQLEQAMTLLDQEEYHRAIALFSQVIDQLPPNDPLLALVYANRGLAYLKTGNYEGVIRDSEAALRINPNLVAAYNNLAWVLATCPRPELRNGPKAVEMAIRACELSGGQNANCLAVLAAAYAEAGQFNAAVHWQKKALEDQAYRQEHEEKALQRLQLYEAGKPYRED